MPKNLRSIDSGTEVGVPIYLHLYANLLYYYGRKQNLPEESESIQEDQVEKES